MTVNIYKNKQMKSKHKILKNGQCYKYEKLAVYAKIIDAEKRRTIHICCNEEHKEISTNYFFEIYENRYEFIDESEFDAVRKKVLDFFNK